jgi:hypothetical protein
LVFGCLPANVDNAGASSECGYFSEIEARLLVNVLIFPIFFSTLAGPSGSAADHSASLEYLRVQAENRLALRRQVFDTVESMQAFQRSTDNFLSDLLAEVGKKYSAPAVESVARTGGLTDYESMYILSNNSTYLAFEKPLLGRGETLLFRDFEPSKRHFFGIPVASSTRTSSYYYFGQETSSVFMSRNNHQRSGEEDNSVEDSGTCCKKKFQHIHFKMNNVLAYYYLMHPFRARMPQRPTDSL